MESGNSDVRILRYIIRHPGSSFTDIMDTLVLNESTLRYHLEKFERKGLLTSKKIGKKRCYFSKSMSHRSGEKEERMNVLQKRVWNLIRNDPGITRKEIMGSISISRSDATDVLNYLQKSGEISRSSSGRGKGYQVISRKRLKDRIFKQIVIRLISGEIDEKLFNELVNDLDKNI